MSEGESGRDGGRDGRGERERGALIQGEGGREGELGVRLRNWRGGMKRVEEAVWRMENKVDFFHLTEFVMPSQMSAQSFELA